MKHFFRSLHYLKAYRGRLAVSFLAVLMIAILWGGGLGLALPGAKILLSPEGLHGWVWNSMTDDRLDAKVSVYITPAGTTVKDRPVSLVLSVNVPNKDGRAERAGIGEGQWLVGLVEDGKATFLRGDILARRLALWDQPDRTARLLVFNSATQTLQQVDIRLHRLSFLSRTMGRLARRIPEPDSMRQRQPLFFWLLGIALGATLLRNICRYIQEYLVETAVLRATWDLRNDSYSSALSQPVTYFAEAGTSDTMSRFVQDSNELARAQTTLFGKTLVEPAKMTASIIGALACSVQLTLVALLVGPLAFLVIRKFGKAMKKSTRRALASWADMLAVLEETLQGIRVVKAYTMEGSERKRFFRVNRQLFKQQRRIARINAATSPTIEAMGTVAAIIAAGWAGSLVFQGYMDSEKFLTWMIFLAAMFDPVRKLSKVATRFQAGDAAAERIFELQDREPEKSLPGAPMLPRHSQSIDFRDVTFRYPSVTEPILRDINLHIAAGQAVAIVGPNGSGKTTLVSLLPRLLEPTGGQILLDGQDIMAHSMRSLRRQIAIVTQETVIFNATIAENIAYGLRRAKHATILHAAQRAYVDEFVRDMPDGYDTIVGQRGATLSGGQRQRIAIARAILRDPAILIFDEALSQIDADSEKKIHAAMHDFMADRTTLMIAHRFSTVLDADAIVVLDEGRIVDTGPHKDLMDRCELYRQLYNTQFAAPQG